MTKNYNVYLGDVLLPVAPEKIQMKIKNQNKTMTLINEGEINLRKAPGLTDISFVALLPNVKYPFAKYLGGKFYSAMYFVSYLESLKINRTVFKFRIIRSHPYGTKWTYNTSISCTLENYTIVEDVKNGFDVSVSLELKQYKSYGVKPGNMLINIGGQPMIKK